MSEILCAKCGANVHPLEVFPDNYCLVCHAERWETAPKPTAEEVKRMFRDSIQLQKRGRK
jgi:hypothetical protein